MNDIAIRVDKLSKQYRIGRAQERHDTLRDAIVSTFKRSTVQRSNEMIWALKDVSFEVKRGEVVGIIGRNGAGKSTLLKILSRITEPTEGRAEIHGRVGSLLEVGTGFHPELTGRENIYLNGTILGMRKKEIDRKFDQIVDFSGVEKFIDTPVKRYSSGMRVRLAFSVAAHLEPEILLIDEVLAVGDVEFQKKCLGKMGDMAEGGRTVLFVSHNMVAVQSLCSRSILLQDGEITVNGPTSKTIEYYITEIEKHTLSQSIGDRKDRTGGKDFKFQNVKFLSLGTLTPIHTLISGQDILIEIGYKSLSKNKLDNVAISIGFKSNSGAFMFACSSEAVGKEFTIQLGNDVLYCQIPKWPLNQGRYSYNILAKKRTEIIDWVKEAGYIDVEAGDYYQTGKLPAPSHQGVFIDFKWYDQPK